MILSCCYFGINPFSHNIFQLNSIVLSYHRPNWHLPLFHLSSLCALDFIIQAKISLFRQHLHIIWAFNGVWWKWKKKMKTKVHPCVEPYNYLDLFKFFKIKFRELLNFESFDIMDLLGNETFADFRKWNHWTNRDEPYRNAIVHNPSNGTVLYPTLHPLSTWRVCVLGVECGYRKFDDSTEIVFLSSVGWLLF